MENVYNLLDERYFSELWHLGLIPNSMFQVKKECEPEVFSSLDIGCYLGYST